MRVKSKKALTLHLTDLTNQTYPIGRLLLSFFIAYLLALKFHLFTPFPQKKTQNKIMEIDMRLKIKKQDEKAGGLFAFFFQFNVET